tara:strand:- start:75 stop:419 length:345 start_codon:yes stop_codon:yes gene_type:complete
MIIYKITDYFPETNQISVSFCNLKSRKPIDDYKSYGVNCDDLDMFDVDSFSESLANKSGVRRIEKQESKLETIEENIPINIHGDFQLQDLVGKVICVKKYNRKIKILHMKRIEL